MKLFANGCSFTWGGEILKNIRDKHGNILDETNTSEINQDRLNVVWPKHLSDKLGCTEHHNYSMACGSNHRIVRKTLEFFIQKINDKEDLSDYIAEIGRAHV